MDITIPYMVAQPPTYIYVCICKVKEIEWSQYGRIGDLLHKKVIEPNSC